MYEIPEVAVLFNIVVWGIIFIVVIRAFFRSICLVPTKSAYIVERLGEYHVTLGPGFHALFPFFDRVVFIQNLKEQTITVPPQECFTKDNVKVEVDGVIYISVVRPEDASYGVTDYRFASTQLAKTTTRSVIGTLDLDRTFKERDLINSNVLLTLGEVEESWGIKVHRYEVKNIVTPKTVRNAMERQMTAERDRRAIIAKSEGERQSRINKSEGLKTEMINKSEGEKQRKINMAEGKACEIESIAKATAESIEKLGKAISIEGGKDAVHMRLSQEYLSQLRSLANPDTNVLLPANLMNLEELLVSVGLGTSTDQNFTIRKPV